MDFLRRRSLKTKLWFMAMASLGCLMIFIWVAFSGISQLHLLIREFSQPDLMAAGDFHDLTGQIIASQGKYFAILVLGAFFTNLVLLLAFFFILRGFMGSVNDLKSVMAESVSGDVPQKAQISGNREIMDMAVHYNVMVDELGRQMWRKDRLNGLSNILAGSKGISEVARKSAEYLSRHLGSGQIAFYVVQRETGQLHLSAAVGSPACGNYPQTLKMGEGVTGQAAVEKEPVLFISPGAADSSLPAHRYALPLVFEQEVYGVVEIASFQPFSEELQSFLAAADRIISTHLYSVVQSERIQLLFEQSEKASQYKSQFLANMSHELRTPLNAIILLSKIMLESRHSSLAEGERQKVRVINNAGNDLLTLINDILDIAKVEAGKMELSPQRFPSGQVLDTLRDRFSAFAQDRNIQLIVSADDTAVLFTDREKLSRILVNFLSNAFKFTEQGSVWLRFALTGNAEYPCAFYVRDTGIGISPEDQGIIFDAFKQVDGSVSRRYGGTGLGLYITTQLSEMLGAEIRIDSTPGDGSEFTLLLPAQVMAADSALPDSSRPRETTPIELPAFSGSRQMLAGVDMGGKRILIVDDDAKNVFVLAAALEEYGAEILEAMDGDMAMARLRAEKIDLILMDVMLPGKSGYEIIRDIRADASLRPIPVVVVTARALPGDREKSLAAGADDYLAKPVDYLTLIKTVSAWLKRTPSEQINQPKLINP